MIHHFVTANAKVLGVIQPPPRWVLVESIRALSLLLNFWQCRRIRKAVAGAVLLLKLISRNDMPKQVLRESGSNGSIHSQPSSRKWLVSTTLRPLYPRERPSTHCTGGWMGLEAVLGDTEISAHTRIGSPDCPAGGESLY